MAKNNDWSTLSDLDKERSPFFCILKLESDRGMALAASAFMDDLLSGALRAAFVDDQRVVRRLLGQDRPLSTFSAKIDLAYCLGIIPRVGWDDLNAVREIRNKFAHVRAGIDFGDQSISDKCSNLAAASGLVLPPSTPCQEAARERFLVATIVLLGVLARVAKRQQHAEFGSKSSTDNDV
jgi:DNA-binding MltR family transcriptional regulator